LDTKRGILVPTKLMLGLFAILITGCGGIPFDPDKHLYTSDSNGYSAKEFASVYQGLLDQGDPIIIYVHGRGDEPNKSLRHEPRIFAEGMAVHMLERDYVARVLMFSWDSKRSFFNPVDRDRPLSNMEFAAEALGEVLKELHEFQSANPDAQRPALIVHSMGNIVLQTLIESDGWPYTVPLFSNIVLSQSDADHLEHAEWLEKMSAVEHVYVTINADDAILQRSNHARIESNTAMGLEPGKTLAPSARYIDITNLGPDFDKPTRRHDVYKKDGMHGQVHVCLFFDQALRGSQQPELSDSNSTQTDQPQRYKLRDLRAREHECFSRY
jgi:hypothetical protein